MLKAHLFIQTGSILGAAYRRGCIGGLWTVTANGCGVLLEEKDENVSIKFKFGAGFAQPCEQVIKAFEWHTK